MDRNKELNENRGSTADTTKTNRLGTEPISKLLRQMAIPSVIAQLVNILYNMVDRMYIGRMNDGTVAMSAIAIALPVVTFITAVSMLLGAGGAPLVSIRLGAKKKDEAEKIMTNSFVALVASGIVLTALILLFHTPLLKAFGADSANLEYASQYIVIYAVGTVFVQIAFGMNPYITTQGFATLGMVTVLIGAILNIIVDPIFIFALGMGVRGAALATILSQLVSALWAMKFLFGTKGTIRIRGKYLVPDFRVLGSICALGVSPFIMISTESLLQITFNNQLSLYGGTLAVGAMSILQSMFQMITMPVQGITQGAQPIISYNYGAGNRQRVRDAFKLLFKVCLTCSVLGIGTIVIFSRFFARIFTTDEQLIHMAGWGLRVFLLGAMTFGAQIACQQSFVALGKAKQSLAMALFRKVILLIPLIFIFPKVLGSTAFAMHFSSAVSGLVKDPGCVFGVLFAETVADATAALVTSLLFLSFYRKNLRD